MKRMTMLAAVALVAGCSAGVGGPAEAPAGNAPPETDVSAIASTTDATHFVLHTTKESVGVLVGPRSITGPGFTLTRYTDASDHAIRGTAFNKTADLEVNVNGAKGLYGGGAFDVQVESKGDEILIRGIVSGKPAMFAINPRMMNGNVGRCMFQMARQGQGYVGTRGCGSGAETSAMSFPAAFGTWSLPEIGSALAILLSPGS